MLQDNWPLVLLGLRIGVAAALYLFLLVSIRALRAEIRARTMPYAVAVPTRASSSGPLSTTASASQRVEIAPRTPARAGDHLEVLAYTGEGGAPGRLVGRSYPLRGPALIGRSAGSTIVLPERQVSSRHARVFPDRGAWWVEDLGSTNGTYIGSRRVSGRERLDPSSEVRFGPVVARLVREPARNGAR